MGGVISRCSRSHASLDARVGQGPCGNLTRCGSVASDLVAGVPRALAAGIKVLVNFSGLVTRVGGPVAACIAILVALGGLVGADVVIVEVAHPSFLPLDTAGET